MDTADSKVVNSGAEDVTEVTTSPTTAGTPASGPDLTKQYEEAVAKAAKLEKDVSAVKSALQKREAELSRQWEEERKRLQDEVRSLRMGTLSDDEKKRYAEELTREQMEQLQRERQALAEELEMQKARSNYVKFFAARGVSEADLKMDGDLNDLIQSGWDSLDGILNHMKSELETYKKGKPLAPKEPPSVAKPVGTPGGGPTWDTLVKKYGSVEEVFLMVEQGILPPSVIPTDE